MRVGVVGAGITGLAAIHHLHKRGIDAIGFETRTEPGGVIRSRRHEGRVLERGPQRLRLTEPIEALIDEFDLWTEVLVARRDLPLYVYCDGRLREVPRSPGALARTDLLSAGGKLRVFAEPLTSPGRPEESAAALFSRKFGREAYENLIRPLFGGIYGSDPAAMPAKHALSGLLELEEREGSLLVPGLKRVLLDEAPPPISFETGLQRLPEALYEAHRDRVRLGTPVTAIGRTDDRPGERRVRDERDRRDDGESDSGDGVSDGDRAEADRRFVLATAEGEYAVDHVVITVDATTAAALLGDVAESARALRDLRYNPLALVYLDSPFDGDGFGYQIRWDEGFRTLGVTWNASLFDRDRLYTCFLGGMDDPDVLQESNARLGRIASEEFEAVLGAPADPIDVARWERGFPAYDDSWSALDALELPDGIHLVTNYTARTGVSSRIREARRLADRLIGTAPIANGAVDGGSTDTGSTDERLANAR